ncbi:MAG TPA: flagellar basal body rod protein FlgF [Rubrivivax sp.]|nr:flagellar basal body rod protein FlgF [Rubrivivax sp.]
MDRLIYLAMSGAKATLQRQDQLAHNLANASTNGFRAELQACRAVPVRGDGASTRVYALESSVGHDHRSGPVQSTGRPLDGAMQGQAWLAVQALDGTAGYTRAGALQVTAEGQLVTPAGLPVTGDGGPITLPADAAVEVASDGTITTQAGNDPPQQAGRLKLVKPEGPLARGEDGLFRAADGALGADPAARVQSGALEGSNVSPVETMVAMIAAARQFEQQMKVLQGAEQREQAAARLLAPQ